ncbi:Gfo/Idh/MocA family oxidoreductase [Jatrophihabitans telluris]|uniref:Gfo/Idh/MocA family oxidoreductase n=1 Tax=Jatrophihabitans telluris TaxID=2038343 RepID=A0ABY4R282_9ACTN|nr:Gfo/Idh/MocA family oxidoreductase [Jatrophihabitans telluris]UQX89488.1 Gfo/Idh/MocA family oxidoreductase [Jatrophihabitans telluris]
MTTPVLRAGVLGFGFAGRIFHAPFLRAAGFEVAGISTGTAERIAQARQEYPDADIVSSAAELIGREDLDLIVVATPNSSHVPLGIAALRAGHDVVVDKPVAATVADARELVDVAEETGAILATFQSRRFDSDFTTVRQVLRSGELGEVYRFESRYERWRPDLRENWRESGDPAEAGGLLYDLGAHLIDQFIALFGVPDTVYAELSARRSGSAVDDDVLLNLKAGGISGQLWMSAVAADAGPRFRILGSAGAFVKHGMDPQEDALLAGLRPGQVGESWGIEPETSWGRIGAGQQWRTVPSLPGDYTEFYRQLARAMAGDGEVPVDPRDSVDGLRVIAAAQRSAAAGTVEPV